MRSLRQGFAFAVFDQPPKFAGGTGACGDETSPPLRARLNTSALQTLREVARPRAAKHSGILLLVVASALLALVGCKVGPNYKPPELSAPAQWSSPLAGGVTNLPVAEATWWKNFRDPQLDSLIFRAVQSNRNLVVAGARVREARALRGVVAAGLWPTADASGSYSRTRLSQNGFPEFPPNIVPFEDNVYQVGFDAAWELDVFGGTRRAVEAARANEAAAAYARREVLVSLLGEVARNYVEARGLQRRLVIAGENITSQSNSLGITKDRYEGGLATDLDVQQAAALLATTEAQVPALETSFKAAAYHLGVLLGQPPGAVLDELSNSVPIPATPPEVPVGLPSELLRRRPDLQRAERQLAAATAQIGVAVSDLFPKFSLTGDVGLQSVSVSDWFTAGSRFWSAGPMVQWRLLAAGKIRANIRVQNARQEQALANYEQASLNAMEDVENALTAYAKEQVRRRSLSAAVDASQQALQLANQLYEGGLVDFLRVLDAQRSLYQAQDALVQSDLGVSLDLVSLYKALGGGWEAAARQVSQR
ncbi:Transcriptional regulator, Fis family [Verrucomicrobia bacterium]|nr:Transcriptional regulator, Fis family [Verrucomicrobiota bacterium]